MSSLFLRVFSCFLRVSLMFRCVCVTLLICTSCSDPTLTPLSFLFSLPCSFPWNLYVESESSKKNSSSSSSASAVILAPTKIFKNHFDGEAYPPQKNAFKVGMKLEAIDPKHQALFCVVRGNLRVTSSCALFFFYASLFSVSFYFCPLSCCSSS